MKNMSCLWGPQGEPTCKEAVSWQLKPSWTRTWWRRQPLTSVWTVTNHSHHHKTILQRSYHRGYARHCLLTQVTQEVKSFSACDHLLKDRVAADEVHTEVSMNAMTIHMFKTFSSEMRKWFLTDTSFESFSVQMQVWISFIKTSYWINPTHSSWSKKHMH